MIFIRSEVAPDCLVLQHRRFDKLIVAALYEWPAVVDAIRQGNDIGFAFLRVRHCRTGSSCLLSNPFFCPGPGNRLFVLRHEKEKFCRRVEEQLDLHPKVFSLGAGI